MEPIPKKSRRPSAGPPAKPPETAATFFIDRDTSGRLLAGELRNRGYTVTLHDEIFQQGTKDPFWIRSVAERGWLILTCDRNIARKEPERSLFGTAPTHTFILYALTPATGSRSSRPSRAGEARHTFVGACLQAMQISDRPVPQKSSRRNLVLCMTTRSIRPSEYTR